MKVSSDLFLKNITYISQVSLLLSKKLSGISSQCSFSPSLNDSSDIDVFDESDELIFESFRSVSINAFEEQISSNKKIRSARVKFDQNNQKLSSLGLIESLIDKHTPAVLEKTLSNIDLESPFVSLNSCRDILLFGSSQLLGLAHAFGSQANIDWPSIDNIFILESDLRELYATAHFVDLKALFEQIKSNNVKIHFHFGESLLDIQEFVYYNFLTQNVMSWHGLSTIFTPFKSSISLNFKDWLFSSTGLSARLLGSLGSTTDEFNQIINGFKNTILNDIHPLQDCSLVGNHSQYAVLVGSGPSLDENLNLLKAIEDRVYIVACGSSIQSLLNYGIRVDMLVLLERAYEVYTDIQQVLAAGHNLSSIVLCQSYTVNPNISQYFAKTLGFHRPQSALSTMHPKLINSNLLHAGPESLNAGIDVLHSLGVKNAILFGVDFAAQSIDSVRSSYAVGSSPRNFNRSIRSCYGKTIYSTDPLIVASQIFELSLSKQFMHAYRIGEGAPLKGSSNLFPEELKEMTNNMTRPVLFIDESCNSKLTQQDVDHMFFLLHKSFTFDLLDYRIENCSAPQDLRDQIQSLFTPSSPASVLNDNYDGHIILFSRLTRHVLYYYSAFIYDSLSSLPHALHLYTQMIKELTSSIESLYNHIYSGTTSSNSY